MFPKPDELFKQSFEQWEKQTADFWNSLLRDPAFLKTMWQSMELGFHARRRLSQATEATLAAWRMPTRAQQEQIQHRLNRLQITLDDLNERADQLERELHDLAGAPS
jgi:hypothetical protein